MCAWFVVYCVCVHGRNVCVLGGGKGEKYIICGKYVCQVLVGSMCVSVCVISVYVCVECICV